MSIPTPFNPLGTLGGGYVRKGLKIFVDALATDKAELVDTVSNSILQVKTGVILAKNADGSIRLKGRKTAVPWPETVARADEPTMEIVARSRDDSPYGLVSTPFAGALSGKSRFCAIGPGTLQAQNGGDYRLRFDRKIVQGEIECVSFVSMDRIYLNGVTQATYAGKTATWSASEFPALISTHYENFSAGIWDIFAVRYYDRKLNATEIARNYIIDKKRFGL